MCSSTKRHLKLHKHDIYWYIIYGIVLISLCFTEFIFLDEVSGGEYYSNHPKITGIASLTYVTLIIFSGYAGYRWHIFKEKRIPLSLEVFSIVVPVAVAIFNFIPKIIADDNYAAMVSVIFSPIVVVVLIGETYHSNKEDEDIEEIKNHLYMKVYIIGDNIIYIPDHINPKKVQREFWLLGTKSNQKKSKARSFFEDHKITNKKLNKIELLSKRLH